MTKNGKNVAKKGESRVEIKKVCSSSRRNSGRSGKRKKKSRRKQLG